MIIMDQNKATLDPPIRNKKPSFVVKRGFISQFIFSSSMFIQDGTIFYNLGDTLITLSN